MKREPRMNGHLMKRASRAEKEDKSVAEAAAALFLPPRRRMVLLLGWLMFPAWTAPRRLANSEADNQNSTGRREKYCVSAYTLRGPLRSGIGVTREGADACAGNHHHYVPDGSNTG